MTIEEAIKRLIDFKSYLMTEELKECCQMAIKALEKQIPKKPKLYQDYDEYPTARCACGAYLGYAELAQESEIHFCPNCGQALLWEVGAEEDDN